MPDESLEPCWICGAAASIYELDCAECQRRWEDAHCRELRERLFPVAMPQTLPD